MNFVRRIKPQTSPMTNSIWPKSSRNLKHTEMNWFAIRARSRRAREIGSIIRGPHSMLNITGPTYRTCDGLTRYSFPNAA